MITKAILMSGGAKRRYFKDDSKAEIWAVNAQYASHLSWLPRVDRAFNLHRYALLKQYGYSFDAEADWVRENPTVPFYTMDEWPKHLVPNYCARTIFPWKDMAKKFPNGMYHCGTFDWLVAYAVFRGMKHIELHGLNLRLENTEPGSGQACLEYWCGFALGKSVKISFTPDSTLFYASTTVLTNRAYGIDDSPIYEDRTRQGVPYDYKP